MFNFKTKNYLKRTDFINSVDSNKIWLKSMAIPEIKRLLEKLEIEISKHEYEIDKNFLMDGRRNYLRSNIEERLSRNDKFIKENILESLFNFWEFVNNEYYTITLEAVQRLNLTREEMENMCTEYTKSGIICEQEKDVILEMIQTIKKYINERI